MGDPLDAAENMNLGERCIMMANTGPMLPMGYMSTYQIVQGPGYVMILAERMHDFRIIPLDGRPHLPSNVRQWKGDSRGRWEGNTLVVDVTNFSPKTDFQGSRENLHLIERWTRTSPNSIEYIVTMDDPTTWTKPWTVNTELTKQNEEANRIYYDNRCQEGNYGLIGQLAGARQFEQAFAEGRGPDPATLCAAGCPGTGGEENADPLDGGQ